MALRRALQSVSRTAAMPARVGGRWIASTPSSADATETAVAAAADATPKYSVVSHVVTSDALTPADYFAVIKLGGTQYKVTQVRHRVYMYLDRQHCRWN